MLLSNESPRSSTPPIRAPPMSECNPDFHRNASERSVDLPATSSLKPSIDDMSEIKPGILEMIQEEQRVSHYGLGHVQVNCS